jgi:hypothetical protein
MLSAENYAKAAHSKGFPDENFAKRRQTKSLGSKNK